MPNLGLPEDIPFPENNDRVQELTLEDIEACFCGRATKEQHARYVAAFDDPDSELNALLNYVQSPKNPLTKMMGHPIKKKRGRNRVGRRYENN